MRRAYVAVLLCTALAGLPSVVRTDTISLVRGEVNSGGKIYEPGTGPIDWSAFDSVTGTGTITVTVSRPGSNHVAVYLDLTLGSNPDDEFADYCCGWPSELSWEIGPPADVHNSFLSGQLGNTVDGGYSPVKDIAMALGWSFDLLPGQVATAVFINGPTAYYTPDYWGLLQTNEVYTPSDFVYFDTKLDIRRRSRRPDGLWGLLFPGSGLQSGGVLRNGRS